MQRIKGKVFERKIAKMVRSAYPEYAEEVRRSIQSRQAEESDVTGLPGFWIECQDAISPTPLKKLEQAEHDIKVASLIGKVIPIAVTHKIRCKNIYVTLRLQCLHYIFGHHINDDKFAVPFAFKDITPAVSILFDDLLILAREYISSVESER